MELWGEGICANTSPPNLGGAGVVKISGRKNHTATAIRSPNLTGFRKPVRFQGSISL